MTACVSVWLIHRGRVRRGTVRSRLPVVWQRSRFGPGRVPQAADTLAAVRDVVTRCAPWLRVYVGPRLWSVSAAEDRHAYDCRAVVRALSSGRVAYEHHGLAAWDDGVLLVAACATLPMVLATVHHEVWHAVERHGLAQEDVAVVDRAAARGAPRPGDYLASAVERRARLYEWWACAADEGWRPLMFFGRPLCRLDRVLHYVYSGGLARDVERHGTGRDQRGPFDRAACVVMTGARELVAWPLVIIMWPLIALLVAARL